jgi:hypothetical protein
MLATDDQIACLTQADPCSVGYGGDGAKKWFSNSNDPIPAGAVGSPGPIDAVRVAQIYPQTSTIQLLGSPAGGEYQLARKLYFNSLIGFANIANSATDTQATSELAVANAESQGVSGGLASVGGMNGILVKNDEFTLGKQFLDGGTPILFCTDGSAAGNTTCAGGTAGISCGTGGTCVSIDSQFCEDFNEQTVCLAAANVNGCANAVDGGLSNQAAVGLVNNTVCGNGVREPYEECDNGTANGGTGVGACSTTCRCVNDFVNGNCN